MNTKRSLKATAAGTFAMIIIAGAFTGSPRAQSNLGDTEESKIQQGFAIAPVPLNLARKNRALVGLGSYIVNASSGCNACHSAGLQTEFTASGYPYLLPPVFAGETKVNPATYLGGGRDFGSFPGPGFPHIVSRNLTPDKTGLPVGGATFQEFTTILRTGKDFDHLHPTCTGAPDGNCLPFPFNGDLLQIMPWVTTQNMSERDLEAIYEYLSSIPCIAGPPAPSELHHDCN